MKKVLIEFFDRENLNNCVSQLHNRFDKIVYLYFERQKNARTETLFKHLTAFHRKHIGVEPEYVVIKNPDIEGIVAKLAELTNKEDGFFIDITGGPELFIVAAGIFLGRNEDVSISVSRYDVPGGKLILSYPDSFRDEGTLFRLTVRDHIRMQGAVIEPDTIYDLDLVKDDLAGNIADVWNAVKNRRSKWNRFCTLQNFRETDSDGRVWMYRKTDTRDTAALYGEIVGTLEKAGLVTCGGEENIDGAVYSKFSPNMSGDALRMFEKGGTLLEMYTYLAADASPETVSVCTGVPVDWDGVVRNEPGETRNEVDVIISNGRIPVFVSCKNTGVTNDFLYELKTVTEHYGGKYARAALVTAEPATRALRKRAEGMNIMLIDNVAGIGLDTFTALLTELMK